MTKAETVKLFVIINALFPRYDAFRNATIDMVSAWAEVLEDIPFEHAKAAVKATVSTSPFPPSISEIRDYATRMMRPQRSTAEEAWGTVINLMREYGTRTVPTVANAEKCEAFWQDGYLIVKPSKLCLEYEAKRHCKPDVWALCEQMGWPEMCGSDNPDVIRGQFISAWKRQDSEAKEARVLGGVVPELVRNPGLASLIQNTANALGLEGEKGGDS